MFSTVFVNVHKDLRVVCILATVHSFSYLKFGSLRANSSFIDCTKDSYLLDGIDLFGGSLPGIFGTKAALITDLTLLIQVVAFILVLGALAYSHKRKYKVHGSIMGIAVLLHFTTFLASMGPSFVIFFTFFVAETFQSGGLAIWIHVFGGVISLILGFFLVLSWIRNVSSLKPCFLRKRMMYATLVF